MSKLRKSAKGQPCTLNIAGVCSYDNAETCLDHIGFKGNRGMGLKPDDMSAVYGCAKCHDMLDRRNQHRISDEDRWFYIARALVRTHTIMRDEGLLTIKRKAS